MNMFEDPSELIAHDGISPAAPPGVSGSERCIAQYSPFTILQNMHLLRLISHDVA